MAMNLAEDLCEFIKREVQEKMFKALGFSEEEAREQFGFLLDAFEYGTPPHGGIAFGLDRIVMLLVGFNKFTGYNCIPENSKCK